MKAIERRVLKLESERMSYQRSIQTLTDEDIDTAIASIMKRESGKKLDHDEQMLWKKLEQLRLPNLPMMSDDELDAQLKRLSTEWQVPGDDETKAV